MVIELIYVTVIYTCDHVACRPVRPPRKSRVVYSNDPCKICAQLEAQEEARRAQMPQENNQVHYMVDGYPMTINQYSGYWRGRRWEHGKFVNKYFGKADPRPLLEEAP